MNITSNKKIENIYQYENYIKVLNKNLCKFFNNDINNDKDIYNDINNCNNTLINKSTMKRSFNLSLNNKLIKNSSLKPMVS